MGGGTGTGSAPVVAQVAKACGALTVGVVTKPFDYEGRRKMRVAQEGIARMRESVDTLIVIPNQALFKMADRSLNYKNAFHKVDDVLRQAVQSITDVINTTGFMNVDFSDVRTAMSEQGEAIMGIGMGHGEKRALEAAVAALNNPLLEETSIRGARNVLINITSNGDISMPEIDEIVSKITEEADPEAIIKTGLVENADLDDGLQVTVIATGFRGVVASIGGQRKEAGRQDVISPDEWEKIMIGGRTKPQAAPAAGLGGAGFGAPAFTRRSFDPADIEVPTVLRDQRRLTLLDNEGRELRRVAV